MNKTFAVLLLSVVLVFAQAENVAELIEKGDTARDDFDNSQALSFYDKAVKADGENCEALWKLARAHVDVGEAAEGEAQENHYLEAEKFARRAVAVCPDNADAHLQVAVAVGRVALISGTKKKVNLSAVVKAESQKALELDPNHPVAHHVLARWHREVANLSGFAKAFAKILYGGLPPASNEKAVEHFKKAIALEPEHINHHLELGITYEGIQEWELAKEEYKKVAGLPEKDSDDPEHKKEAARRLELIKEK